MFLGPSFGFTEDKMLIVFGFLLMFYAAASGSQSQDPVECGFTESDICYVSWGQQVHLSIPSVDVFNLIIKNRTILRYRKSQTNPPKPNSERWQFNTETNTLILTSAEWSDFGTYNLETFDAGGTYTGNYNLTIYMKGSQSQDAVECRFTESDICNVAQGQQVHLQIPSGDGFNLLIKNRTILSYRKSQTKPPQPNSPRWQFVTKDNTMILTSAEWSDFGTYNLSTFDTAGNLTGNYTLTMYKKDLTVIILSSVCVSLIVLAVSGFFVYKKIRRLRKKKEWWPKGTQTKPSEVPAPVEDVNYALVVTQPASQRNLEKRADDVHYTELMFPSQERSEIPEGQDKCVYSQIQYDP